MHQLTPEYVTVVMVLASIMVLAVCLGVGYAVNWILARRDERLFERMDKELSEWKWRRG